MSKPEKGLMAHEVFETPEQRYQRKHMRDGALKQKVKKVFRKLFVNEQSLSNLSALEAQVERRRKEAEIIAKKKKYQSELESYNKERKRVRKIYNDFVHGGTKSANEWKEAMSSLKQADSFGDILSKPKKVEKDKETEVVVIENPSSASTESDSKPKEDSIW